MNWLGRLVQQHVTNYDTVLDLGCGVMQATTDTLYDKVSTKRQIADRLHYKMKYSQKGNLECKSILGCDIHRKYLDKIKDRFNTISLKMDELDRFVDNSFDVVLCLDVLEHLELMQAMKAVDEMKRIARKKVIIYTPSVWDDNSEHVEDAWELGENQHQQHHCLVPFEELKKSGFAVSFPEPDKNTFAVYTKLIG